MSNVDRLIELLVNSDTPLVRDSLMEAASTALPQVAPLAPPETAVTAVDSIVGLGPLEELLADDKISDVLVNGPKDVWIERGGELVRTGVVFPDDASVIAMVRRVIAPLGLRIDHAEPSVDARLPDGSRLHAAIPPASVDGTVVAIRRFHPAVATLEDLVESGSLEPDLQERLASAVEARDNILVAGPTGAGKTTLLNVLCSRIPTTERVVTIEDAAELRVSGHVIRLECRRANVEGAGDITMRQLLRHALRLRPDRIVVGEVRGPEALDMIQALTTGHRGSMSTIHADGPESALARLEMLAAMAPEAVPHGALRSLVKSAIDVVVSVGRRDGHRVVRRVDDLSAVYTDR